MVKVVWFLKKADHLSMDEFRRWWLGDHAPVVVEKQGSMLTRYVVNIRADTDGLPGAPNTPFEWDGMAEEWFESDEAAHQAFTLPSASNTRNDVMAHVSKLSRLVVTEHSILDGFGASSA